ncbi:ATPase inhibitor, mitochondrial-like isoform X3 [Scyliorhinus canicula]|uniref:ATPase inhibitor, mitochondrial-like isoform X3 n=1 Tax=Scyliorhinus canicula TaxID=7830 RepID=UPI0018F6C611|nr:ATPase inhibitor, mitochondrial-like isoform X3 [Scyliorhinus canicula]
MARLVLLRSQFILGRQLRSYGDSSQLGELGKGAGKGGGGGGSIREAGGAFGRRQAAIEEKYFREKESEQIETLRKHHEDEIDHHEHEIQRLQNEIKRRKTQIKKLKSDGNDSD